MSVLGNKDRVVAAEPGSTSFSIASCALIIIDMQRDFLEPGGFGEALGNDVAQLRKSIEPCEQLLKAARTAGMLVIHTREGHRSDMLDVHAEKVARCPPGRQIGDMGPMGRILIRGEAGHDFIASLQPLAGEVLIDKPGKGAFYSTELELILHTQQIRTVIICGVTTEVCVSSTVREANDRGFRVLVPGDCCASYFPEFHNSALAMISAQGAIFGYVTDSHKVIAALQDN